MQKRKTNGSVEGFLFLLHTYCAHDSSRRQGSSPALKEVTFDRQESTNKKANA